jgi:putative Holliday junction resolvase
MAGTILALDIGAKRIGVAVSDELGLLATPRTVIFRRSTQSALDEIVRLVRAEEATLVVVGLPISLDGQLHGQAQTVQRFGERLRTLLDVPMVYADEMLSTVRAEERLRAAGVRAQRIRERIDAMAAAVILEEYLEQRQRAGRQNGPQETSEAQETQGAPHPLAGRTIEEDETR